MRTLVKLKNKLKHLGEPHTYAIAVANRCRDNAWHVFYDYDGEYAEIIWALAKVPSNTREIFAYAKTKHGIQIIGLECMDLEGVRLQYDLLHTAYQSDYFWTIPLYLRISPKWDERGKIVSDMPEYFPPRAVEFVQKHFPAKKIYKTWD